VSLKIAGRLFAGPFPLEKTVVRKNHDPAVFAIISREGKPWNPLFHILEVGETGPDGVTFEEHPASAQWRDMAAAAAGTVGVYLLSMARAEHGDDTRRQLAEDIRTRYSPPTGYVPITGM